MFLQQKQMVSDSIVNVEQLFDDKDFLHVDESFDGLFTEEIESQITTDTVAKDDELIENKTFLLVVNL